MHLPYYELQHPAFSLRSTANHTSTSPPMRIASPTATTATDVGLVVLRMTTGSIAAAHGAQKLFVTGIGGVSVALEQIGVPFAAIAGPTVGLVELLGGVALIVGCWTRLAGASLALTMLGAIGFVHLAGGFFAPTGFEFPLALLGAASTLAGVGAGRYSLDALRPQHRAPLVDATPVAAPRLTSA